MEKLLERRKDLIKCENCIFNEGCEKMFTECVANFIKDSYTEDMYHLKYCDVEHWNTLNEDKQKEFIKKVLEINDAYKEVESNVK